MEVSMQALRLDGLDIKILRVLQDDARLTNNEIGERVGLSASQCSRRRAALEAAGIITGYHAALSYAALGLELLAFVQVRLSTHAATNRETLINDLAAIPEVVEAYSLTGAWDYILKIVLPNLARFDELLNTHFLVGGHIAQTQSSFVLKRLKQSSGLPLPSRAP
jgi:DNA-binding Lrp family transcriptional regulator